MQVPTFQKFRKLLGGVYPFSLKEIVTAKGEMPLPSAQDYYQGTGDSPENRQIMIRKGADLKKRKRPLKKILDGDAVTMTNEVIYICDEKGSRVHILDVLVDESAVPFFREQLNDTYNQVFSFIENSDFVKRMPKDLSMSEFPKARNIMKQAMEEAPVVFLYFDLMDEFTDLIIRSAFTGLVCAMIGVIQKESEENLLNLARMGILQFLGDDRLFSGLPASDAIEQKVNFIKNIATEAGYDQTIRHTITLCHKLNLDLVDETPEYKLAQMVQTANAILTYLESGVIAIGDEIEQVKGKYNVETSFTKMVLRSNPKVNATCPDPLLHEIPVNALTKAMGYGHIIERERHIRTEILRNCLFTNCLSNRASVICEHEGYTPDYIETNTYCGGIGPSVNVITGTDKSRMVPRCQKGSENLLNINEIFAKAKPTQPG